MVPSPTRLCRAATSGCGSLKYRTGAGQPAPAPVEVARWKCEGIRSLRNLNQDRIVDAVVRVVLGQLDAQSSGLHSDRGIALRIESSWTTQNLGRDLIFLERDAGVIEGVLRQIAEQFAEGFRAVEAMAFGKSLYLLEALLPSRSRNCVLQPYNREVTE